MRVKTFRIAVIVVTASLLAFVCRGRDIPMPRSQAPKAAAIADRLAPDFHSHKTATIPMHKQASRHAPERRLHVSDTVA